jgi:hypothetical protein
MEIDLTSRVRDRASCTSLRSLVFRSHRAGGKPGKNAAARISAGLEPRRASMYLSDLISILKHSAGGSLYVFLLVK